MNDRVSSLVELQDAFNTKIIVYFTGERQPEPLFSAQIAIDVIQIFYEHLQKLGNQKRISLFLFSNGGNIDAPWPLVSLIREYCKDFQVIIPHKALSAATLICCGANKIIMTPFSHLSPVDPQGQYVRKGETLKFEIEDILGFIDLAKEKIGISEQASLIHILRTLVNEVQPSILGSINRTHALIRRLCENLLRLHLNSVEDDKRIKEIVQNLTHKLFSHRHLINRSEAKNSVGFGSIIKDPTKDQEAKINTLFSEYYNDFLECGTPFNPEKFLDQNANEFQYEAKRAIIESESTSHVFISKYRFTKDNQGNIKTHVLFPGGWQEQE